MKNRVLNIFIYVLVGLLGGFVFPPFNKYVLFSFCGMAIFLSYMLYGIEKSKNWKIAFGVSFGLSFLSNIVSFSWMVRPFEFVGAGMIAPFIVGLFDFGWALFAGIVGGATFYMKEDKRYLGFALMYAFVEWVKSWIFTGFPWNPVSLIWSESLPVMQVASLVGSLGLSFLTVFVLSFPYLILKRKMEVFKSKTFYFIIFIVCFVLGFGWWRVEKYKNLGSIGKSVKLVNLNVLQDDKYNFNNLDKYIEMSKIGDRADIIVWSETSVPTDLFRDDFSMMKLMNLSALNRTSIITGFNRIELLGGRDFKVYNTMVAVDKDGILDFYDKRHLVPFGEYIPLKFLIPFKKLTEGAVDFSSGVESIKFDVAGITLYPLICYEAIFSGLHISDDVDFIVNISNDKWFARLGKVQHSAIVKFRAVEEGVPVVRVANDGISGVISPLGDFVAGKITDISFNIKNAKFLYEVGVFDVDLISRIGQTLFSKTGNWVMVLFLIFGLMYSFGVFNILILRRK
ncbi:MAG: apolipoprotein N-acyltransferase [Alphaproteobacteria bacterium]